jgi:hypothetical protein
VKITASNGVSEPQVNTSTPRRVVAGAATPQEQPQEQPRSPDPTPPDSSSPSTPPASPNSPAEGITVGDAPDEVILSADVPAEGTDLLRGANVWVRPSSKVEYVLPLPKGLRLVKGKLVASKPGTYKVKIKVKRKNGTSIVRTIKIKVG